MILRGLRLDNIRSYTSQEIAFPKGSVLLSGDIGSGKSTILLAIDFALFGIQKDLSGASLLRHGKEQGSVELDFEVGGREYKIKRTLKRSKDSVRQIAGYIVSNGAHKDLTAQESKSFILELLGYPPQALRKDSALLYRYTVYTPQEQMKQIMEADAGERLDLIRRLFGMDRYKRIAENAEIYARELRSRIRELSGSIADLDLKTKEREELSKNAELEKKTFKEISFKLAIQDAIAQKKKKEVEELQEKIEAVNKKKQEYASLKAEFDALKSESLRLREDIDEAAPKLKEIEERISKFKEIKKPAHTTKELNEMIASVERSERECISRIASLSTEIKSLSEILERGVCGTCKQKVVDSDSFKKGIEEKKAEIEKLEKASLRAQIEDLRKELCDAEKYDSVIREQRSFEERRKDVVGLKERYAKDLESKEKKQRELVEKINVIAKEIKSETLPQEFKEKQRQYEELRTIKESIAREESALKQKIVGLEERIKGIGEEIKSKEATKKKIEEFKSYDLWIKEFFINLMGTIEKHVFVSVQHEFNSLFQKWFSMLVMDENITARVDENFSVLIEQDGFETDYSFMSGGERTAVALAYRLALNRVINDLIEKVKTKDLLILDEPTDGFSSDQMNSVREVLAELNNKQTIVVSHEPKVESFVDTTLRFAKENGVSKLVA